MTEDEMVGWHHRLNRHKFEQAPGDGEGQGGLECCSLRGHKESDMTEQLNKKKGLSTESCEVSSAWGLTEDCSPETGSWQQHGAAQKT